MENEEELKANRPKSIRIHDSSVKLTLKYCDTCKMVRPPRSFHCSTCNVCVEIHNQHCRSLATCIGKRNHRAFVLFLFYACFYSFLLFVLATYSLYVYQPWWQLDTRVHIYESCC